MSKPLSLAVVLATFLAALAVFGGLRGEGSATAGGAGADTHLLRAQRYLDRVSATEDPRHYAGAERELDRKSVV